MILQHNLSVFTLYRRLFLISGVFHYGVTFEWHRACCHSHVLRFPLISSTSNNNDYSSASPTICVIVVGCQTQALTFAVLSAGVYKYKHICLSYWPLSPHFLDSLLQLLTIQTHGTTHNLSFTEHSLSLFVSLPLPRSLFSLSLRLCALAICLNKMGADNGAAHFCHFSFTPNFRG